MINEANLTFFFLALVWNSPPPITVLQHAVTDAVTLQRFKPCSPVQVNILTLSWQTAFRYTLVHCCTKFYSPCHRLLMEKDKFKEYILYLITQIRLCVCVYVWVRTPTQACVPHLYSKFLSRNQAFYYINYLFNWYFSQREIIFLDFLSTFLIFEVSNFIVFGINKKVFISHLVMSPSSEPVSKHVHDSRSLRRVETINRGCEIPLPEELCDHEGTECLTWLI